MKKTLQAASLLASVLLSATVHAADAPQELNLGILGGQTATQQIGDNQCVKTFLDDKLGVDTQLRNSSDYAGVIQGLLSDKVDLVLNMSPSSYASVYIENPDAVDLVGVTANDSDNAKGYYSVVVVKADSPYQKLEDLKGKTFGFADPNSTSGYLIPDHAFQQQFGGNMDDRYDHFFSDVTFSGGHEQDILGVLNDQFDGAVTWASMVGNREDGYSAGAFRRLKELDHPDLMDNVRIIWQSNLIPNGPLLVRHDLPEDFKNRLVATVHDLDKNDHDCFAKATGGKYHIESTSIDEYRDIIDMKRELTSRR
ncbi:phosphonate ABC transporter substrate-binding protein [Salinicola peritrichatus]|uniref:phosphonate ABC transporter substrate-binding protein n=1 Tax=Salinicola peritrichatus TaxID=1267424 RepID=UPI000DA227FE|nr:phosphonate ABC transporter substrate-binding protein [Salinicola peritrichatus]